MQSMPSILSLSSPRQMHHLEPLRQLPDFIDDNQFGVRMGGEEIQGVFRRGEA